MDPRGPFHPELLYNCILKVKLCKIIKKCCKEVEHDCCFLGEQLKLNTLLGGRGEGAEGCIRNLDSHNTLEKMEGEKNKEMFEKKEVTKPLGLQQQNFCQPATSDWKTTTRIQEPNEWGSLTENQFLLH